MDISLHNRLHCTCQAAGCWRLFWAGGKVPVGAVESCVSGTNVAPWTPANGAATDGALYAVRSRVGWVCVWGGV